MATSAQQLRLIVGLRAAPGRVVHYGTLTGRRALRSSTWLLVLLASLMLSLTGSVAASAATTSSAHVYDLQPQHARPLTAPGTSSEVDAARPAGQPTATNLDTSRFGVTRFAAEDVGAASTLVSRTVADVGEWLGADARVITNDAGDKIFLSKDGLRRIRVDINRPTHTSSDTPTSRRSLMANGSGPAPSTPLTYPVGE
jgi:hypothetical protein